MPSYWLPIRTIRRFNSTYTVTTGPVNGQLELTTAPGVAISAFTQADINAGVLVYVHDGSQTTSDSFTFTVSDGAGGSLGATIFTLTVMPVNDPPVITSPSGYSIAENTTAVAHRHLFRSGRWRADIQHCGWGGCRALHH